MIPIKRIAGKTGRYVRTPQEQVEFDRLRAILNAVLRLHEPDVTSWDAGDLRGCLCDNWDGRDWDGHRAHVVQALSEAMSSWLKSGGAA